MEIKKPKVLILVLCSRNYLSYISSNKQKKIWQKNFENIQIHHFVGKEYQSEREVDYISQNQNKYLEIETNDNYDNIAKKTLLAFDKISTNYEFDYVFRTNTSSFIDLRKFKNFILNNTDSLDYAGSVLKVKEGDLIASGAGFFLSRKNIQTILDNREYFDVSLPDDVAIARLLKTFNINPTNIIRKDVKSIPNPREVLNSKHFHYRCRLDPTYHRILEPLLLNYLNRASEENNYKSFIYFYFLKTIFYISNIKIIYQFIQKYYSYKFYGEIGIKNYLLYKKNKL